MKEPPLRPDLFHTVRSLTGISVRLLQRNLEPFAQEHERFANLLSLVEEKIVLFHAGQELDYDLLRKVFFYLTAYADRFHHPKEDLLFAKVAQRAPEASGPVAELRGQHRVIAESGARFLTNLDAVLGGTIMSRDALEEPAIRYAVNFRKHMALEAQVLFPLALTKLRPTDWTEVHAAIAAERDAALDEPFREWYRALLRQISSVAGCSCAHEFRQ